jgi:hypothetical protein
MCAWSRSSSKGCCERVSRIFKAAVLLGVATATRARGEKSAIHWGMRSLVVLLLWALALSGQQTEMDRAVEEFKLQTQNLGLRPDSPANLNGGRKPVWHGRVFENFRNDFLDAVPHEIRQRGSNKSLLRRNQFGFNIAGPVLIPRLLHGDRNTFFSVSYEGVREHISRTYLRTIPTIPERTGDYSSVVDPAGEILPIFDAASTRLNSSYDPSRPVSESNLQYAREPFAGNRIPPNRLDPVAQRDLKLYPQPNTAAGPFFQNNFFINAPETNTANGMLGKVDHTLSDRQRVTLDLAFSNGLFGAARWFPTAANPGSPDRKFNTRRCSTEHVFTASANTVNTATFSASSTGSNSDSETFPVYQFSPYLSMGKSYPVSNNANNTYAWSDALSTRRSKHSLRLSAQYAKYQVNSYWPKYPNGMYRFGAGLTSLPGVVDTGHAFASYLLGLAEYAEASLSPSPSYFRRNSTDVSFRDQYEAAKGLTISFGLSVDRFTPRTEKYNRQSTIDFQAINPANERPGALVAAGRNGIGRAFQPVLIRPSANMGLAWNPGPDPRMVVRVAFSRSYGAMPVYSGQWGTQGFSAYPTILSPNVQLEPATILSHGLPLPIHTLPDLRPEAANDTVADLIDMTDRAPVYQSSSLSIERELPGSIVLTAGAAYSGGKNLPVGNSASNPNAIPLDALRFRDQLNDEDFNRSLRPYPQYKGFDVYSSSPVGRYQRDATYVRLEKRASNGLSISAYYEYSKQLDDYSGPYGKQDYYNRQNEWSLTPGNEPHRLQVSYVYELPLGPNKAFLNMSDWRRHLVDGWAVSGVATLLSGNPVYLRPLFNNTGGVVSALNVNSVPGVDPHVSDPGPALWFNPAAFDQPPDFSIGDVSRTHPSLRNPGNENYDLSITKRVTLAPDRTIELSAAGFNFVNHADWNDPDNTIGPASAPNVNAGKIIGSRGGRVIQLGLRFSF